MFVRFSEMLNYNEWTKQTYEAVILRAQNFVRFFFCKFCEKNQIQFSSHFWTKTANSFVTSRRIILPLRPNTSRFVSPSLWMNEFPNWFDVFVQNFRKTSALNETAIEWSMRDKKLQVVKMVSHNYQLTINCFRISLFIQFVVKIYLITVFSIK